MKRERGQDEPQEVAPQAEQERQKYTQIMTGVWVDEEGSVVAIRDSLMGETLETEEGKVISKVPDKVH